MGDLSRTNLLKSIEHSLNKEGHLYKLKAELRGKIFELLNKNDDNKGLPEISDEKRLINELIREYLVWSGYFYTEQILTTESGQNNGRLNRDVLTTKLGVVDDENTLKFPLLCYIIAEFQQKHNQDTL